MAKKTTGKKTLPEHLFHGEMLPPDDPIFKLGFVIGQRNASNFSVDIPENPSDKESEKPINSKEDKKRIEEAQEKIFEIFSRGEFPDYSVEKRHLGKYYGLKILPKGKARFCLDRHPHAFGFTSLGMPSSAYRTITIVYELDIEMDEIIEIDREAGELFINYEWLADDEVQQVFSSDYDNFDLNKWEAGLEKIDNEEKAKQYAIRAFEEYYIKDKDEFWFIRYDQDDLPEDFKQIFLKEIKKQFVPRMVELWEGAKEFNEDDE